MTHIFGFNLIVIVIEDLVLDKQRVNTEVCGLESKFMNIFLCGLKGIVL